MTPTELFPGFKTPPNQGPPPRTGLTVAPVTEPCEVYFEDDDSEEPLCEKCDGWGYLDCFCGGDLCVCQYNGEIPCWNCC